jgi:hypothetical protein
VSARARAYRRPGPGGWRTIAAHGRHRDPSPLPHPTRASQPEQGQAAAPGVHTARATQAAAEAWSCRRAGFSFPSAHASMVLGSLGEAPFRCGAPLTGSRRTWVRLLVPVSRSRRNCSRRPPALRARLPCAASLPPPRAHHGAELAIGTIRAGSRLVIHRGQAAAAPSC